MREYLKRIAWGILDIQMEIMGWCFAIVLTFLIVVLVVFLVWWVLDEMQKRR